MTAPDLKAFLLLREFSDQDREALADLLEEKSVPAGRRIFAEGDESDALFLLASGTARVESRRCALEAKLEGGATLGALSLTSVGPRESTVIAETACEVLILPRTA